MSNYFNIESGSTDNVLPYDYRPGTKLISKVILTDKQFINMLVKVLVPEVTEDYYVAIPTEFINKNKYNVLYAPHDSLALFGLYLLNSSSLNRKHGSSIYETNIISTKRKLPQLRRRLKPFTSTMLLHVFASMSINSLDYGKDDKIIKLLYSIAHANLKQLSGEEEEEKLEAISNIYRSTQIQLHRIKGCLEIGDKISTEKALSYVDNALGFLQR